MKKLLIFLVPLVLIGILLAGLFLPLPMTIEASEGIISLTISIIPQEPAIGEVLSARAECSKTNYLGGGHYSIDSFIGPIHYREDAGLPWLDIDTNFNPDGTITKAPYQLEAYLDNGMPGFHIRSRDSGEYDIRIKEARADSTSITPIQYTKVIPVISGNRIIWRNCFPNIDVELVAHKGGATLQRIIKSAAAAKTFDVAITEIAKGSLSVAGPYPARDNRGQEILMISSPIEGGRTETLSLQVISPDPVAIQYPITDAVDVQVGASADDVTVNSATSGFNSTNTIIYVGRENSAEIYSASHRFDGITIAQGSTIDVCYITIYEYASNSGALTNLFFEEANDTDAPTSYADYIARNLTEEFVAWDGDPGALGWRNSPSLVAPCQEVIDAFGLSNQAMQVFHKDDGSPSNSNRQRYYSWDYSDHTYGVKLHIEYTETGGEPDIYTDPTSKAFGILTHSATHWSKGSAPTFPIDDSECFFIVTNNGTIAVDLTANVTDPTGGTGATCVDTTPGADEVRVSLFAEGDGSTDNTTIVSGTPRAFYSGLAVSANISWEVRLELGTSTETPPTGKTFTIKIIAAAS